MKLILNIFSAIIILLLGYAIVIGISLFSLSTPSVYLNAFEEAELYTELSEYIENELTSDPTLETSLKEYIEQEVPLEDFTRDVISENIKQASIWFRSSKSLADYKMYVPFDSFYNEFSEGIFTAILQDSLSTENFSDLPPCSAEQEAIFSDIANAKSIDDLNDIQNLPECNPEDKEIFNSVAELYLSEYSGSDDLINSDEFLSDLGLDTLDSGYVSAEEVFSEYNAQQDLLIARDFYRVLLIGNFGLVAGLSLVLIAIKIASKSTLLQRIDAIAGSYYKVGILVALFGGINIAIFSSLTSLITSDEQFITDLEPITAEQFSNFLSSFISGLFLPILITGITIFIVAIVVKLVVKSKSKTEKDVPVDNSQVAKPESPIEHNRGTQTQPSNNLDAGIANQSDSQPT